MCHRGRWTEAVISRDLHVTRKTFPITLYFSELVILINIYKLNSKKAQFIHKYNWKNLNNLLYKKRNCYDLLIARKPM